MSKGKQGVSTGGIEKSPARRKREAAKRKRQEDRWAARSGPVEVRRVEDQEQDRE